MNFNSGIFLHCILLIIHLSITIEATVINNHKNYRNEIGDTCETLEDCSAPNSECIKISNSTTGVCECDIDSYFNARVSTCLKYAKLIGDSCEEVKQCKNLGDTDFHDCLLVSNDDEFKTCACKETSVPSIGNYKCLPIRKREEECEENQQCIDTNHSCLQQVIGGDFQCRCSTGFVWATEDYSNLTACLNVVNKYNGNCSSTTQCNEGELGPSSVCYPNIDCIIDPDCVDPVLHCICNAFASYDTEENRCYRLQEVGQSCSHDKECRTYHSQCNSTNAECECNPDSTPYTPFGGGTIGCYTHNLLGDNCVNLFDCAMTVDDSNCVNGTCTCYSNYFPNVNNQTCYSLPYRIGHVCDNSEQCQREMNNTSCVSCETSLSRSCQCNEGYFSSPRFVESCIPYPILLQDRCIQSDQCPMEDSYCNSEFRCGCFPGYHWSEDNSKCTVYQDVTSSTESGSGDNSLGKFVQPTCQFGLISALLVYILGLLNITNN